MSPIGVTIAVARPCMFIECVIPAVSLLLLSSKVWLLAGRDLFTKILSKQEFDKHRKAVLNLPGGTGGVEHVRREAVAGRSALSQRDGTGAT